MFELNPDLDISVFKDLGPNKISAITIDNFYKDPWEVRRLALTETEKGENIKPHHHYGDRGFLPSKEVAKNFKPLFDQLLQDDHIWGANKLNVEQYSENLDQSGFMWNINNDDNITKNPLGIIPHQDTYSTYQTKTQYGVVIYLNTPEECNGGTLLYSYCGRMILEESIMNKWEDIENFDMMRFAIDSSLGLNVEFRLNMAWNRCVIYPASILHCPEMERGWFMDHDRIAQVLFL